MREYIDAYSIANTIRMSVSQRKGAFVIVEGSSDALVYKRFMTETCRIVPALGKVNATGALKMLEHDRLKGILAIIDSDFWQLDNIVPDSPNLFTTDTHDLETMIIASEALEKVLEEFCVEQKNIFKRSSLRAILFEIGKPLGFFRWISSSHHDNLCLRFKNLDFRKFIRIEGDQVSVHVPMMVHEVRLNTRSFMYREQDLVRKLEDLLAQNHADPWHVCRGHDLVDILTFLLRDIYGNRKAKHLNEDILDALLRLAYEYRFFLKTRLCESIRRWERANGGYTVLIAV